MLGEIYWDDIDSEDVGERRLAQVARLRTSGPLSLVYESNTTAAARYSMQEFLLFYFFILNIPIPSSSWTFFKRNTLE